MSIFSSKMPEINIADIQLPTHIGIIMDGNGRWAKKRGLPRTAGHKVGAETFRKISRYCSDIGIKYLTVYAFSTENWKRPLEEVNTIMTYFRDYLNEALRDFADDTIRLKFLGDISGFSKDIQDLMRENEQMSSVHKGMVCNIYLKTFHHYRLVMQATLMMIWNLSYCKRL